MKGLLYCRSKFYDFDVVVIGAGSGGLTVAVGCQKLGLRTALIEGGHFGGDCLNFGCVPSKTLIASATAAYNVSRAGDFGVRCSSPETDWSAIKERIESVKDEIRQHENPQYFRTNGMEVFEDYASFTDPHTLQVGQKQISSRYIVIATGSRPAVPPVANLQEVGFVTNETVFSMQKLPGRLGIVGAGPIGCELAQAFSRLGTKVILLDSLKGILDKEDDDMAALVADQFEQEGISIGCGAKIEKVSTTGESQKVIHCEIEGVSQEHSVDELLISTGRRPNTEKLDLEAAGIETDKGAIRTDPHMRTSQRHIFAVGDVTGGLMFTHMASQQAGVVIKNMVFGIPAKNSTTAFPWVTYVDPELASVGYNEKRAGAAGISYELSTAALKGNDRALATGEAGGIVKILTSRGKIIGAQILAPHAGELIPEFVMAIAHNLRLRDIASLTHAYPTLAESNKKAASDALAPKIFSDKVRALLRGLYGFGAKQT